MHGERLNVYVAKIGREEFYRRHSGMSFKGNKKFGH